MESAQIIQNSTLTALFQITGQVFWAFVCLIGILTIVIKAFQSFRPTRVKKLA